MSLARIPSPQWARSGRWARSKRCDFVCRGLPCSSCNTASRRLATRRNGERPRPLSARDVRSTTARRRCTAACRPLRSDTPIRGETARTLAQKDHRERAGPGPKAPVFALKAADNAADRDRNAVGRDADRPPFPLRSLGIGGSRLDFTHA